MSDATFLGPLTLLQGAHARGNGMCAMEAAAYLAGEAHSDHPICVSPVIAAFMRRWNDRPGDAERQRLKPLVVQVLHTATGRADEQTRAWLCADWAVREHAPLWLDAAGLSQHAAHLRACAPLVDKATAEAARKVARNAATAAADADADAAATAAADADAYAAYAATAAADADATAAYAAADADAAAAAAASAAASVASAATAAADADAAADASAAATAATAAYAAYAGRRFPATREAAFQSAYRLVGRLIAVGTTTEAPLPQLVEAK